MNESKNNVSIRRIGLCWEATRAPRWTRIPQAGARGDLRSGRPACGIDHNAINPGLRGKTSTKTKRISNLTAVRKSDIHAEPVQAEQRHLCIRGGRLAGRRVVVGLFLRTDSVVRRAVHPNLLEQVWFTYRTGAGRRSRDSEGVDRPAAPPGRTKSKRAAHDPAPAMKEISGSSQHHRAEPATNDENALPYSFKPTVKPCSISFYVLLAAALFAFIETFSLLSPILLSLILILLISLAVNPLISQMRALTGGRKVATGLVAAAFVLVIGLTGWAFIGPLKTAAVKIAAKMPSYLERLQNPLMKTAPQVVQPQAKATTGIQPIAAAAGGQEAARATAEPAPPKSTNEPGAILSNLIQMLQGVASGFKSMALNASQIMVVFITVFFGVTFTLMNPRPIPQSLAW